MISSKVRFKISQGTGTTGGSLSDPTTTVDIEGSIEIRPSVCLTAVGDNLGDVNMWVNSLTYGDDGQWSMVVESSIPSVDFHYRVFGHEKI
jgi:hypothetical protein